MLVCCWKPNLKRRAQFDVGRSFPLKYLSKKCSQVFTPWKKKWKFDLCLKKSSPQMTPHIHRYSWELLFIDLASH